jgi:hypothetical protein
VLAAFAALVFAADAPQILPDIDPLKQSSPVLPGELTYEPDLRPGAQKIIGTLRESLGQLESGTVLKVIVTLQEPLLGSGRAPGSDDYDDLRAHHVAALERAFVAAASPYGSNRPEVSNTARSLPGRSLRHRSRR